MKKQKLWFFAKSFCLFVLMLMNASVIYAQSNCVNDNGGFEEVVADCPNGNGNNICFPGAFNNACLNGWRAANGSPDICTHPVNTAPPAGLEYYARMGTRHSGNPSVCRNEAVFSGMDLEPAKTYTLSFYHKTVSKAGLEPISIKVYQTGEIENITSTGFDPCANLEIPPGSELLHSNSSFQSDEWILESFCFTAIDYPNYGLLFVPEAGSNTNFTQFWLIDNVCVAEYESCDDLSSVTSCPSEDDYGYIIYDNCYGEFNWEFPTGSTAQEFTSYGFSAILKASPGIYSVTITDANGCEDVQTQEMFDTCCDDSQDPYYFSMPAYTNEIAFDNSDIYCFSWVVSTICSDDSSSEPSDPLCFNYLFQDCFEPGN